MFQNQRIRYTVARSFLVIFTLMLLNGIVFRHAHRLSNGKVITHAHPYKPVGDSPFQPNNHTSNELFLLNIASNTPFVDLTVLVVLAAIVRVQLLFPQYISSYLSKNYSEPSFSESSLRGPPMCSYYFL